MPLRPPWLLLDVDGVLCTLGAGGREPTDELHLGWQYVRVPQAMSARLTRLRAAFRLAWATGWGDEANDLLAPALGLPPLPVIAFPDEDDQPGVDYKLPAIRRFVRETPTAWVDDDIGVAAHRWASSRAVPTLLVETHPGRGLQDGDVETLLDWAASLSAT